MNDETNTHPDSVHLDALALGGDDARAVPAEAREHVTTCASCKKYVSELRREISVAPSLSRGSLPSPSSRALLDVSSSPPPPRSAVVRKLFTIGPILAAAAAMLLYFRLQGGPAADPSGTVPTPSVSQAEVHFKGGLPMAVVRERAGVQSRHTHTVDVQAGDRLRIEVALDTARPIAAGILDDTGSYTSLLAPSLLDPGTHYSDRAARIDEHPTAGWVLAGEPEALQRARVSHDWSEIAAMPIRVEATDGSTPP